MSECTVTGNPGIAVGLDAIATSPLTARTYAISEDVADRLSRYAEEHAISETLALDEVLRSAFEVGEVVKRYDVDRVSMTCDSEEGTEAFVDIPKGDGFGNWRFPTDFDAGRRMVEGKVSVLIVVSDGGEE